MCVAYDTEKGHEVAAKVFEPDEEDGTMTTETLREISALRLLSGVPGIVPLLDVALELSGLPDVCAILPLYPWSVADAIEDTSQAFKGSAILRMATGVLRAVSYMHSCTPCIVHRDIKPENVMLDDAMDPVLIDFSFCKQLIQQEETAKSTTAVPHRRKQHKHSSGAGGGDTGNLGTPTYVAPEVLASGPYDDRADVWSMGVMFLEAFQKKRLDTGKDKVAQRLIADMRSRLGDKPVPLALKAMLEVNQHERCRAAEALRLIEGPTSSSVAMPPPIVMTTKESSGAAAVDPRVAKLCKTLKYNNPHTPVAATHYLGMIGALEASRPHADIYVVIVAGKVYEQCGLNAEEAAYDLRVQLDVDDFAEFEENLLCLSDCCLFTPVSERGAKASYSSGAQRP